MPTRKSTERTRIIFQKSGLRSMKQIIKMLNLTYKIN